MAKLLVPDSCKSEVPVEQIAKKQEMVEYKTKGGETRETPRYRVTVSNDGKVALMVDTKHPDYKKYLEKKIARKKEIRAKMSESKLALREKIKDLRKETRKVRGEAYEKGKEVGYKRGLSDGKPRQSVVDRLTNLKAKEQEIVRRRKELEGRLEKTKKAKKEVKKEEEGKEE